MNPRFRAHARRRGFTLMELMVVIGIIGIVLAMGVPSLLRVFRKEALRQATSDIIEIASNARAQAVQHGETVELVFNPESRSVSVGGGGGGAEEKPGLPGQTRTSASWADSLTLEMLDVNFREQRDRPSVRVRFFPNGTCDEATVILRNDANEYRMIFWEVTTGLAQWETDPAKFINR